MASTTRNIATGTGDRPGAIRFSLLYRVEDQKVALVDPKFGPEYPHAQDMDVIVREYFGEKTKRKQFKDQYVALAVYTAGAPQSGYPIHTRNARKDSVGHLFDRLTTARPRRLVEELAEDEYYIKTQLGAVADATEASAKDQVALVKAGLGNVLPSSADTAKFEAKLNLPEIGQYQSAVDILANHLNEQRTLVAAVLAKYLSRQIEEKLRADMPTDYAKKREFAKWLAAELRRLDLAIRHPSDFQPCVLRVLPDHDTAGGGVGRFYLADRETNKKSWTNLPLDKLLPLHLVPDIPRRESVTTGDADL